MPAKGTTTIVHKGNLWFCALLFLCWVTFALIYIYNVQRYIKAINLLQYTLRTKPMKELIKDIYCCCIEQKKKITALRKLLVVWRKHMKIKINCANNGLVEIKRNLFFIFELRVFDIEKELKISKILLSGYIILQKSVKL